MADFEADVYAHLAADTTLTGLLGAFVDATSTSRPAIFVRDVPGNVPDRYIVINPVTLNPGLSGKNANGNYVFIDLACYDSAKSGSSASLDAITRRVESLTNRVKVPVTGLTTIIGEWLATVPNDGPEVYGNVVSIRLGVCE